MGVLRCYACSVFVFPIKDSPNVRAIPWLTWLLVLCHLFVLIWIEWPAFGDYASTFPGFTGRELVDIDSLGRPVEVNGLPTLWTEHAYWPPYADGLSLLSGLFLHPGAIAALVGVFLLAMFGDNVEHHVGRRLFAAIYIGGGVVGTLVMSLFVDPKTSAPIVGSGAALGVVMGAYFVFFRRNEIRIVFLTSHPITRNVPWQGGGAPYIPARVGVVFCVALVTGTGIFSAPASSGLSRAIDAVLPGFAVGLAIAYFLRRWFGDRRPKGAAAWYPNELQFDQSPGARVASLIQAERLDDAVQAYLTSKEDPESHYAPEDLQRIATWLEEHGMVAAAEGARRKHLCTGQVQRSKVTNRGLPPP